MQTIKDLAVEDTFFSLDENGKLDIPDSMSQIKIDVGLAGEAPNSAIWLSETTDRFVIGIEPLAYHWKMIKNFETSGTVRPYPYSFKILQTEEGVVKLDKKIVTEYSKDRFMGLHCAIDNIPDIKERLFYEVIHDGGRSGSSSFLKPLINPILNEVGVPTISLSSILELIPEDRFPYIEHIKTDCEGYDPAVVRSIGEYLNRVVFLSCEHPINPSEWKGTLNFNQFIQNMKANGFSVLKDYGGNIDFVNDRLKHLISDYSLNNKTLGL